MTESADPAVAVGRLLEIEKGEGVRFARAGPHAEGAQQRFTDQMGWHAARGADADIHAGFAEMDRPQLRVAVGEVQEMHVAEARSIVEALRVLSGAAFEIQPRRGTGCEDVQEFASGERHADSMRPGVAPGRVVTAAGKLTGC